MLFDQTCVQREFEQVDSDVLIQTLCVQLNRTAFAGMPGQERCRWAPMRREQATLL